MPDRRVPVQRSTFIFEEMDDESLLYHEGMKKTIYLNESATIIWKLCDSTRSVQDIIDILNDAYADSGERVDDDVTEAVASLAAEGALRLRPSVEGASGPTQPNALAQSPSESGE